jgi:predicted nucleic acid-binding protein
MTRLFLDTNIVVDLLEGREPFCYDAAQLFTMAHDKKVELLVSPMTFSTASFLLRKHGSKGVRILLSNLRQLVSVTISDERTVDDSIASQFKDFEDAMQYYTALNAKAEIIITRNGKDFTASNLPVMTATEYIANRITITK